jgi:pimeloyl-ACP methyl ester carboxylesterase
VRARSLPGSVAPQWLHRVVSDGDDRIVEVDAPSGRTLDVLWIPAGHLQDWSEPAVLREDPADPVPRGDRRPIVLVHGLLWASSRVPFSVVMRPMLLWNFRRNRFAERLRRRFKVYAFDYPSFCSVGESGRELVRRIRELYPGGTVPERHVVLVGHSLGGLVSRAAMSADGFGESVGLTVTLASPHHGTFLASLVRTGHTVREAMGRVDYGLMRRVSGQLLPACPAMDDIRWVRGGAAIAGGNGDGDGDGDAARNPWMERLNAQDRYMDRLVVAMGDCPRLTWPPHSLPLEYVRRLQGRLVPALANADPLVPFASGTFEGAPVERIVLSGVNHLDWALRPAVLDPVVQRIDRLP